jgi:hypothetical protein
MGRWLLLLACFGHPVFSQQALQPARFEWDEKGQDNGHLVISLQQHGLAVVRDADQFKEGRKIFEVIALDTALQTTWQTELALASRMRWVGYEPLYPTVYLLFREGDTDDSDLHLLALDLRQQTIDRYNIKQEVSFRLSHFSVVSQHAVLGGYISREPSLLLFDLSSRQLKVVPGFFSTDHELLDVRVNQNNTFNVLSTSRSSRERKHLALRTFDEYGRQLLEDKMELDADKSIVAGITSALAGDDLLVAGTYAVGNNKVPAGFFFALADPFRNQAIAYFDFAQTDHFLDYMPPRRTAKIIAKAQRQRESGKAPDFKVATSVVKLEETNDGFLLHTEQYQSSSGLAPYPYQNSYYNPYFNPVYYGSPYGMFPYRTRYTSAPNASGNSTEEVRMLQGHVLAIDKRGKPGWGHSLPLKELRLPSLQQLTDFYHEHNKVFIAFKADKEIYLSGRVAYDKEYLRDTTQIKLKNPADVIRQESSDSGLRHWYGRNFFFWGYQSVKDQASGEPPRSVFYINKLCWPSRVLEDELINK